MKNLAGKTAIVTGAAGDLGKAIAEKLSEYGTHVVLADIDEEKGAANASRINGYFIKTDVTVPEEVQKTIDLAVSRFGQLDIYINNAGTESVQSPMHLSSLDDWHRVIDVNLNGMFYGMKYALAQFIAQGTPGVIINMVSIAGLVGFPELPSYNASKGGIVNLTREAAVEYGKYHIRVNAVAPTAVRSAMLERYIQSSASPEATRIMVKNMNPIPDLPEPEDIAAAVAFLASDDARFITGVTLPVDAGYTAR